MKTLLIFFFAATSLWGGDHLYFAYGSNLNYEFLQERLKNGEWIDDWHRDGVLEGPAPIEIGCFVLDDFEFGYTLNVEPFGEQGTAGNIRPKKGSRVYGVVYKISDDHLAELDRTEDVPEAYLRVPVKVKRGKEELIAWAYVGNSRYVVEEENPDPIYVDLLVREARARGFDESYIENFLLRFFILPL